MAVQHCVTQQNIGGIKMFKFKKIVAFAAAAVMAVSAMAVSVSAATVIPEETSISSEGIVYSAKHNYSFSNVGQRGAYASGDIITLTRSADLTISFSGASSSAAAVTIVNSSNVNDTYGTFIIPTGVSTTLYTYYSLPAGSYRFYVTPYDGISTSGSFTATVD